MDGGAWLATVQGAAKSDTAEWLSMGSDSGRQLEGKKIIPLGGAEYSLKCVLYV